MWLPKKKSTQQPHTPPAANSPVTPSANPLLKQQAAPNSPLVEPESRGAWRSFGSILLIFIVALGIAVFLTVFVFQQYQVDGPSMQPTLQNNNRLIVWKVPRTWARLTGHAFIPKRGDIIIFDEAGLPELSDKGSDQLVKRVIGLPGDKVVVKDGLITIYNKQHPNGFDPDKTLSYGKVIGNDTEAENGEQTWTLGPNQIFVCGDNRTNSLDSRTFGPINASQIIGQLVLRITPASEISKF
jgi:signal peptidase I